MTFTSDHAAGTPAAADNPEKVTVSGVPLGEGDFTQVFFTNEYTEKVGELQVRKTVTAGPDDIAIDPNRVYLMGYSAGGDGAYAIAPRMPDRFAGVNMSSGHPNSVSLLNTSSLPFLIQVGIRDYYSEDAMRSVRGAEFEDTLNGYHEQYGFGYPHRVLVHVPNGHFINDFTDAPGASTVLTDPAAFARRAVSENWLDRLMEI